MKDKLNALSAKLDVLVRRISAEISGSSASKTDSTSDTFEVVRPSVYRLKAAEFPENDQNFNDLLCTSNVCFVDGYPVGLKTFREILVIVCSYLSM